MRTEVIECDVLKTRQKELDLGDACIAVTGRCVNFQAVAGGQNNGFIHDLGLGSTATCHLQCLEVVEGITKYTPCHCQLLADFNGGCLVVKTNSNQLHTFWPPSVDEHAATKEVV